MRRRRLFFCAIGLALLGLVTIGIGRALPGVVQDRVEHELAAMGLEDARFEVRRVGPTEVVLADVVLGPDLSVETIAVDIDPLALRIAAMELVGARFTTALTEEALEASTPARLLAQDGGSGAAPAIHLERARIIATTRGGSIELEVDGEVRQDRDAELRVQSALGEHALVVEAQSAPGERTFDVVGAGGGDALNARMRIVEQGPVSVEVRAVVGGWASGGVRADAARLTGSAVLDDGRIATLDLGATAAGLAIDDTVIGRAELRATRDEGEVVWRVQTRAPDGLSASAEGELSPDPAAWIPAFAWTARGPVPGPLIERAADFLALPADPEVTLAGEARLVDGRWSVAPIEGEIAVQVLRIPDAELVLDAVRVDLRAHATLEDGRMEVAIEPGSRLRAAHARLDALGIEALEATPELRIVEDADGLRVHALRPIDTRMERLTIGEGPSALGFEDVAMTLASDDGAPIATSVGPSTTLAARMEANAPRIAGLLRGRRARAVGSIDVEIVDDADPRIAIPLEVRASRLEETESEVALANAWVRLPLRWERGDMAAEGRMRASTMAWRAIPIGPTRGAVRIASDTLTLDWTAPATRDAEVHLDARIGLDEDATGEVRLKVPRAVVEDGDPLQRVLAELTEQVITGPMDGEMRLDLRAPERGDVRLRFHGADLAEAGGGLHARQVHGTLHLTSLDPLVSPAPAFLRWKHLELGGVKLDAGAARLAFRAPTDVVIRDMRVALAGGRIDVAPIRFDREQPELALDLVVRGVELEQVLQAATRGGIHGRGKLDGRVALHLVLGKERRILLGDGHLASRGPGTLRVRHDAERPTGKLDLGDLVSGSFIRRRVLAAIEDFVYQRLSMNVVGEGTRHVRARVVGRGKRMPQELDMTLNFRGVQPLLDHAVRLWPSGAEATFEVETP